LNALIYNQTESIAPSQYSTILEKIFIADENSNITQFKISLLHINNSLNNIFSNISDNLTATELNEQRQMLVLNIGELKQTQEILTKKIDLLKQRDSLITVKSNDQDSKVVAKKQIESFINQYSTLRDSFNQLLSQATAQQDRTTALIAKALAQRQALPGFNLDKWFTLGHSIKQMLLMSVALSHITLVDIHTNLSQTTLSEKIYLYTLAFFTACGFIIVRHIAIKMHSGLPQNTYSFLHQLLANTLRIFIRQLWLITLIIASVLFLTLLNLPKQLVLLIFHLGNTLLIFCIALMAARISLYETISNHKGNDVKLYHRLFWLFSFGFIIRLCMILSEYFNTSYEVQDLFDRTFMLFIFFIALMLLKASQIVPELIIPAINPKRHYLIRSIKLLAIVIPLIILSNAVIGLAGYVALAWTISKYEGIFLLVTAGYLISLGLFNDALNAIVARIVRHRSGWIITEAFVKPLSIWIYLILFIANVYFLLYLYDLSNQAFIVNYFNKILYYPLLSFSGNALSVWTFIKTTIVAMIAYWATKWTREFCYRNLYKNVQDIGVRNSLATFSQYGICILGVVFTLKTLQVDLTTLAVIAGGLAVGVGFGLRDLTNNFISGFIILIERPMRCGDTVSIGEYEGRITHIGVRATTIIAADNREIIVPNSEAFSKTFINWNRQDDIIRAETHVKVPWKEEPQQLEQEIRIVIEQTEGVVTHPAAYVVLKEITESLLEFDLYFYFNYRIVDSRPIMISRVLFNVWQRLRQLGIEPPYTTQNVIVNNPETTEKITEPER
jgi:potassium efflux system protein